MPFSDEIPAGSPGYDLFERQVAAVKRLLDKGLIKHWGLSNENAFGISMFCVAADKLGVPRPVSCQNVRIRFICHHLPSDHQSLFPQPHCAPPNPWYYAPCRTSRF